MDILKAVLMGVIQGATEFLPVSSSGHLALLKGLFGMDNGSILFDILLHLATLVAICTVFWKDILKLIVEFGGMCRDIFANIATFGRSLSAPGHSEYIHVLSNPYRKFVLLIIISTIPTGIIGVFMKDIVEYTSSNLLVTGICLLCTGLILALSDFLAEGDKKLKEMDGSDAFAPSSGQQGWGQVRLAMTPAQSLGLLSPACALGASLGHTCR